MVDKIKIGIIGLGRISTLHLNAYKLGEKGDIKAELVAVADTNKKRREEVSKEFNIDESKSYKNYEDLLADKEVDAVEILTPHHLHHEMTIKAANAGKHISLQKVPAMTLSEMDSMIEAAKKNKVKFRVYENFRFYEPYMKAMELINNDVIGKVTRVDYRMYQGVSTLSQWKVPLGSWKWRISEKSNYNSPTIWDDGYHKHSIIAKFLGQPPITSVLAWQGNYKIKGAIHVDVPTVVIYSCKNKVNYGTWNVNMVEHSPMNSPYYGCDEIVDIIGTKGQITVPGCTGSFYEACNDGGIKAGVHWVGKDGEWKSDLSLSNDWATSFIHCSRAFIDGLLNDKDDIELTGKDARYILQIGLAMMSSVRNNFREVKLKEIKDGII